MARFLYCCIFFITLLQISACQSDLYQNVPQKVSGLGFLTVDTGASLKSTFSFRKVDMRDSVATCQSSVFNSLNGFDSIFLLTYHGVQLVNSNGPLFLDIKGAKEVNVIDASTIQIESTIGRAIVKFDALLVPSIVSFNFKFRIKFPSFGDCLASVDSRTSIFGSNSRSIIYFECPVEDGKLKYGWTRKELFKPKCYF
ncbi:MAG: hypothetical protein IT245_07765 [Bacteroidia bacterium]|nr:hypothetical protein [Bacteroidia bacterium]